MKNKKNIIITLLTIVFLMGCEGNTPVSSSVSRTDDRPSGWSPLADLRWKEVATGEIERKIIQRNSKCNDFPSCDPDCISHNSYCVIVFKDGKRYSVGQIRDFKLVSKRQYGTLYKYDIGSPDNESWFMWTLKRKPEEKTVEIEKIQVIAEVEPVEPVEVIKTNWERSDKTENLKSNKLVLIKLDNDIIAIGFLTYDRKWKLNLNINKYQHGETLTNVYKWKQIDTE